MILNITGMSGRVRNHLVGRCLSCTVVGGRQINNCFQVRNSMLIQQIELFYLITYFSTVVPLTSCVFFLVRLSSWTRLFQQIIYFFLSPGLGSWQLEFKSLIISIIGFRNFFCCLHNWNNLWFKLQQSNSQARRQKELEDLLKMSR